MSIGWALDELAKAWGYRALRRLPDGKLAGIADMVFTTALMVGITEHCYERRYCYALASEAEEVLTAWDGQGDPPGPWIKEKPSDRLGPGATA